jgi:hypothetical protein
MAIHAICTNPLKTNTFKCLILKGFFISQNWHSHCTSTTKLVIP